MVKLRLKRLGTKKKPIYRVVAIDSRKRRDGRPLEEIGFYDPRKHPSYINIDKEAARKWLSQGAEPSDTVRRLLKQAEVLESSPS